MSGESMLFTRLESGAGGSVWVSMLFTRLESGAGGSVWGVDAVY